MSKREMLIKINELLKEKNIYSLDGINANSNKSTLQNAIDCLECGDETLNDYLTVLKLKYPNTAKRISENGDFKRHSFNRLYVYNTARSILA